MIVREVRLENVKSYGSPAEVIHFQRGVNAISGPNGSGKSTILEAIGCALFQHLPYPHEKFVREGVPSGLITVVVESSFDQRVYEVVRRIGRSPAQYVFDPDIGQQIARGEADVGRWLRQHLALPEGIDLRSLFLDSVGTPQGTLTAVFLEAAQLRKGKFNRLLQVEEYEEAYRKLSALDLAFDGERKQLEMSSARLEAQTAAKPDLLDRRDQSRQAQSESARELARLELDRASITDVLDRLARAERVWASSRQTHRLAEQQAAFSVTQLARARAEEAAAAEAFDRWTRARPGHDAFVEADAAAQALEQDRATRDRLVGERVRLDQELARAQNTAQQLDRDLARANEAAAELTELIQKIPHQVELEQRLELLRSNKSLIDEAKRRLKRAEETLDVARQHMAAAQVAIRRVEELRPLAVQLSDRQTTFQAAADRLAQANQAEGQLQALRQAVQTGRQEKTALEAQLLTLDREIVAAERIAPLAERLPMLAQEERSLTEKRAAAAGQLQHAGLTRTAVAGGLCPFLHETCRNLRPGVTLEDHFDAEVDRWTGEVRRIEVLLEAATRELQTAQQAATRQVRLTLLRDSRVGLDEQLKGNTARLSAREAELVIVARQASGLADARRSSAAAQDALRAAERAQQEVDRLPALEQEETTSRSIVENAATELSRLQSQVSTEREIVDALVDVTGRLNELGSPRQRAEHLKEEAARVPELQSRRRNLDQPIAALQGRLSQTEEAVRPYADLDDRVTQIQAARNRFRPDYEAHVKSSALASELGSRRAALGDAKDQDRATQSSLADAHSALEAAVSAYDADEHQARLSERELIDKAIGQTQQRIEGAALTEHDLSARLADLERTEGELRATEESIVQLDLDRQLAGSLRQAIRAAGPEITRHLLGRISLTASRINADILNQSGVELEWTTDYDIVTRRGGETRGFAQLSGGEQMAAALAVRLAILRYLSNARVAFLDEPTAHLDQDRRTNLGDQVQRLQGFDQLVVISHDDTFDGLFGHVIHLARQEGRTRVLDHT